MRKKYFSIYACAAGRAHEQCVMQFPEFYKVPMHMRTTPLHKSARLRKQSIAKNVTELQAMSTRIFTWPSTGWHEKIISDSTLQ